MYSRKIGIVALGLMVTGALVSLAPTAAAQTSTSLTLTITPPTESVKPLQGALNFGGVATLTYSNEGIANLVGIPVTYTVSNAPAWAQVVVSPASDVFPVSPSAGSTSPSTTVPRQFTVSVTASDPAPAFQPGTIEITAVATPSQAQGKSATAKVNVPVTAAYFSILDTQLAEAIKIERPQQPVVFPLKVTNLGNANTKVAFAVEDKAANLNVPVPIPIVLQSKQAGGNQISSDVPLTVQTPYKNGYMNEVGVVTYHITSSYALDPKLKGDETRVSVVVTTKGFYVPGAELPILLGLLGVAALVLRRK